jgi:hypothetical protein
MSHPGAHFVDHVQAAGAALKRLHAQARVDGARRRPFELDAPSRREECADADAQADGLAVKLVLGVVREALNVTEDCCGQVEPVGLLVARGRATLREDRPRGAEDQTVTQENSQGQTSGRFVSASTHDPPPRLAARRVSCDVAVSPKSISSQALITVH